MDKLLKYNGVQEALKFLREDDERTLKEHLEMCPYQTLNQRSYWLGGWREAMEDRVQIA